MRQQRFGTRNLFTGLTLGVLAPALILGVLAALSTNPGDSLTRNTVRLSLVLYALSLAGLLRLTKDDWAAQSSLLRLVRGLWTLAWAWFLVHVLLAFHVFYHWSHTVAFLETRRIGGVGEGIYVNEAFLGLWTLEVAAWWFRPHWYATRSPWLDRLLHAFMAFIAFNATVVFAQGPVRWFGLLGSLLLCRLWLHRWTSGEPPHGSPETDRMT